MDGYKLLRKDREDRKTRGALHMKEQLEHS